MGHCSLGAARQKSRRCAVALDFEEGEEEEEEEEEGGEEEKKKTKKVKMANAK